MTTHDGQAGDGGWIAEGMVQAACHGLEAARAVLEAQAILEGIEADGDPTPEKGNGISEAASEKRSRKKRGRPGVTLLSSADPTSPLRATSRDIDDEGDWDKPAAFITSGAKTRRGIQDSEYAFWAALELEKSLDDQPQLAELIGAADLGEVERARVQRRHIGILSELGRILKAFGPSSCLLLALQWAGIPDRPPSKRYAKLLRRWRLKNLGRPVMEAVGDARGLEDAILAAIRDYFDKNPATARWVVIAALDAVYAALHEFLTAEDADRPADDEG
jgi:hypothetical protein